MKSQILQWRIWNDPRLEILMNLALEVVGEVRSMKNFYGIKKSQRPNAKVD